MGGGRDVCVASSASCFQSQLQDCRVEGVGFGSGRGVDVIDPMASQRSGQVPGSFLFAINVCRISWGYGDRPAHIKTISVSASLVNPHLWRRRRGIGFVFCWRRMLKWLKRPFFCRVTTGTLLWILYFEDALFQLKAETFSLLQILCQPERSSLHIIIVFGKLFNVCTIFWYISISFWDQDCFDILSKSKN